MRFHLRTLLIVSAVVPPLAAIFYFFLGSDPISDAYAQWGAADMVIAFMRDHDGEWPRN